MLVDRMLKALLLSTLVCFAVQDAMGLLNQGGCKVGYVRCRSDETCVRRERVCDGSPACPDKSDEENCPNHLEDAESILNEDEATGDSEAELGKLREGTTTWGRLLSGLEERAERFRKRTARNKRELESLREAIAAIEERRRSLRGNWTEITSVARNLSVGLLPLRNAWLGTKDFFATFLNRARVV